MTYQEIKERLSKCELTLEKIKDGKYTGNNIVEKTKQLTVLKESLQKQLLEAQEKTYLVTPKSGKTKALSLGDDEVDALEDADDIDAIKSADGEDIKEMKPGDPEDLERKRMKRLSSKDQEAIQKIRAMMQAEKDKVSEVEDDEDGHIGTNTDADFEREQQAQLAARNEEEGSDEDVPAIDRMYNSDAWVKAQQDAQENKAEDTEGGDLDVGHQDDEPDMLKQYAYDIAHYAAKLYKQLDKYDKMDGEVDFPNWWQSKVILAKDYISKAQHYLEFEEKQPAIDQLALEEGVEETSASAVKKEYDALVGKMKQLAQHYKTAEGEKKAKIVAALKQHTARKRELEAQLDKAVAGTGAGQELDTSINEYRGVQDDVIEIIKDMAMNADGDEIEAAMEIMEFIGEHYKIDFEFGRAGGGNYGRNDGAPYEGKVNEAEAIPSTILRGYNKNIKNAQSMAQALISVFKQLNNGESINFERHSGLKRVLALLDKVANTQDTETPAEPVNEAKGGKYVVRPCSSKNTPWAVWKTSADGENDKRIKGFKTKPEAKKFADEKNGSK